MNSGEGGGLEDLVGSAWKRNLAGNCPVPRGMGSKNWFLENRERRHYILRFFERINGNEQWYQARSCERKKYQKIISNGYYEIFYCVELRVEKNAVRNSLKWFSLLLSPEIFRVDISRREKWIKVWETRQGRIGPKCFKINEYRADYLVLLFRQCEETCISVNTILRRRHFSRPTKISNCR